MAKLGTKPGAEVGADGEQTCPDHARSEAMMLTWRAREGGAKVGAAAGRWFPPAGRAELHHLERSASAAMWTANSAAAAVLRETGARHAER